MTHRETTEPGAPCWIEIMTSDQEGARAFYGDLFGWTSTEPQEEFGGYLNFAKDGRLVAGCMGKTPEMADGPDVWSVYVATENAKAVADAAAAHGGQVIAPPMQVADLGTMAVVADPAGAVIGAWQPGTHPGFGVVQEPGAPGWFELHTRDYETSVDFHRQVFGWTTTVASDTPDLRYTTAGEGDGYAGMMDASAFLPPEAPSHWAVYFAVDDVDAAVARVVELGGTVVQPAQDTPYGRLAAVADPTGAGFRLMGPTTGA